MDNELICNKFINQYLLRGRKFVEYTCFRYGYYNAQISGKIGNGFVDDFQYFVFTKSIKSLGSIRELLSWDMLKMYLLFLEHHLKDI